MSQKTRRFPLVVSLVMGVIVGLIAVVLSYFNLAGNLERSLFDLRFSLRGTQEPAHEILIVGITPDCLAKLGRWPWDRDVHARLLDVLTAGNAAVVGMDIIFAEPSREAGMDEALISATARAVPVVYAADIPPMKSGIPGFLTARNITLPLPELMEVAETGFVNVTPDIDGILRRSILWMELEGKPIASFDLLLWALAKGISTAELYDHLDRQFIPGQSALPLGNYIFPLDMGGRTPINYSGGPQNFPVLPYHLVVEGAYPPSFFEGAVILVGYFAEGLGDYYFTPFARDTPMYGVECHANTVNTLLHSGPIRELPVAATLALVFLLALASMLLYQALRPLWGFASLLVLAVAFYLITLSLFNNSSFYVETFYPMFSLGVSYISALAYNFIAEQRDRQRVTRIFGRYVAPQVVDEILSVGEENLKLGGIKRRITILFIDIRGFTPLSEKLTPEGVVAVLNEYFDIVTKCIFENKGTIDKFIGDAAMALFNAPLPLEDHALWAVRAGKAITEEGAALQKKVLEMSGVTLHFGIGINTGDAVVGNIGSVNRMDYTAIGDAVNLAARLESNAKPGQVLVSESVYEEVAGRLPLEPMGEIPVKGKSKPVKIFQLIREEALAEPVVKPAEKTVEEPKAG
ncbi:MAG: adenylate/guanylate cyclase domain-containing protein [Bacillota bacterium]